MYAIVKTGGKQYQVEPGKIIEVEKLDAAPNDEVTLSEVLLVKDGETVKVGSPTVANTSVKALVVNHDKSRKVIIFKFKRRKNYRRKTGHRQEFTRLRIQEINVG
jgi:large subunit ribosomal protein L21